MNKKELEKEIFNCEDWGFQNRFWISEQIEKARLKDEITEKEKVELYTLVADEMEGI